MIEHHQHIDISLFLTKCVTAQQESWSMSNLLMLALFKINHTHTKHVGIYVSVLHQKLQKIDFGYYWTLSWLCKDFPVLKVYPILVYNISVNKKQQ